MDKILSVRISQNIEALLNKLTLNKKTSKKQVLESAIKLYWAANQKNAEGVFDDSSGIWQRENSTKDTLNQIKNDFKKNYNRHYKS